MIYKFLDKKAGSRMSVKKKLTEGLHKPVITKFKKRKVYATFKYNIWNKNKMNKNVKYLLCVIDVFIKYACVKSLKD